MPHDHSDPNSSSSDIVEDDAEELQDDGPLTDFATFYPTISPLPPSLSPKYEGKYDLEMEGEKAWPTKGEVESELDKRFVNNTYAYQVKPSLGFSRFYSHEVALRLWDYFYSSFGKNLNNKIGFSGNKRCLDERSSHGCHIFLWK